MMTPTRASADLERLQQFVGVWNTEGEVRTNGHGQPAKFSATDTYEWVAGGHFLLHRFDADMPDGKVQGIEVIGYNSETASYPMHSFDSTGNASLMQARVDDETWTFVGEAIRFTGRFCDNGETFSGCWELRRAGASEWEPMMDVTLRKVV